MKRNLAIFLQVAIALIGIASLTLMLWLPHIEGRNAHATVYEIYFNDPFLAFAYFASIAYYIALYQIWKLVRYAAHNELVSRHSVNALRTIRYCAATLVCFILAAEVYFFVAQRGTEDIAGGVMMGLILIIISVAVGTVAAVFERRLRHALDARP